MLAAYSLIINRQISGLFPGLAASSLPCRIDGVILSTTLRRGDEGRPFVEEH
jgi:hypothetical protein